MTTKEYLQQIYVIRQKIRRLNARRDTIRLELYAVKSPAGNMSADRVQSSVTGDRIERLIAKVDAVEQDIVAHIEKLEKARARISEQIEAVPDERYRRLLHQRYEQCWTWERIAVEWQKGANESGMSVRHIYRLHGEALRAFEKIIKK